MEDFSDIINDRDTDIIPAPGNFYFIENKNIRKSLSFDYDYFNQVDAWEVLKLDKKLDKNTISFWNTMKLCCYHKHTDETYQNNLFFLEIISIHGWSEFVILYITWIASLEKNKNKK